MEVLLSGIRLVIILGCSIELYSILLERTVDSDETPCVAKVPDVNMCLLQMLSSAEEAPHQPQIVVHTQENYFKSSQEVKQIKGNFEPKLP